MEELVKDGDEIEWKETARWVKFEEDVEEGGDRVSLENHNFFHFYLIS